MAPIDLLASTRDRTYLSGAVCVSQSAAPGGDL